MISLFHPGRFASARRPGQLALLSFVVVLASLGQVLPLGSAIFEIDLARDVTEGFAILDGLDPPRQGPEIGGRFHLGPWWFYLVAAALSVVPSLTAYTVVLGALASLKFALAAWIGVQLGGTRLAVALVAATALPGVTAYQFFGVTHTNFVEVLLWLSLAALLALRSRRLGRDAAPRFRGMPPGAWVALSALALCLALHAHPTAVAALPLWLALLVVCGGGVRCAGRLIPWAIAGGLLPLIPALPEMTSAVMQLFDPAVERPYARAVGDDPRSVLALLRGVLWTEPATLAGTAFAAGEQPPGLWRGVWIVLVGSGLAGGLWAALTAAGPERALARWSWVGVLVTSVIVAQLVRATPFYATYVISVPLALVLAIGWVQLSRRVRKGLAFAVGLIVAALALQWLTALAFAPALEGGWVRLRVPEGGGVKAAAREARDTFYVTVRDRDRFARDFCAVSGDRGPVNGPINGPYATALDASQGHELRLAGGEACRQALRFGPAGAGRSMRPVLPLPRRLVEELGLADAGPRVPGAGVGWVVLEPARVISPTQPVLLSSERIYPPRLRDWERGRDAVLTFDLVLAPEEALLVSPLTSLHLGWSAELTLDAQPRPAEVDTAVLRAWRCRRCTRATAVRLTVRGLAPEFVNVVTVGPKAGGL